MEGGETEGVQNPFYILRLENVPLEAQETIVAKLEKRYAACARLTCKTWKNIINQKLKILQPNKLQVQGYSSKICAFKIENFLVNELENLRILDLELCRNLQNRDLSVLPKIKKLNQLKLSRNPGTIRISEISDEGMEYVSKCTNLLSLNLTSQYLISNDGIIKISENCTNMQALNISNCKKIDVALAKICENLTNLTYLNIGGLKQVQEIHISNLNNLKNLKFLQMAGCENISDSILDQLLEIPGLYNFAHSLQLTPKILRILPQLKHMGVYYYCYYYYQHDKYVDLVPNLVHRELSYSEFQLDSLKLFVLSAGNNLENIVGYFQSAGMQNLKQLQISTSKNFNQFPESLFQNLKILNVKEFIIDCYNQSSSSLQKIFQKYIQDSRNTWNTLSKKQKQQEQHQQARLKQEKLQKLKESWFSLKKSEYFSNLNLVYVTKGIFLNSSVEILSQIPNLYQLQLEECYFPEGFRHLKNLKNLRYFSLYKSTVQGSLVSQILEAFENLDKLFTLNLEHVQNAELGSNTRLLLGQKPPGVRLLIFPKLQNSKTKFLLLLLLLHPCFPFNIKILFPPWKMTSYEQNS